MNRRWALTATPVAGEHEWTWKGDAKMVSRKAAFALAGLAALTFETAGQTHPSGGSDAQIAARERATNRALLDALLKRRAEIAASVAESADRKDTLGFLDRRIAELRHRLGE